MKSNDKKKKKTAVKTDNTSERNKQRNVGEGKENQKISE